MLDEIKSLITRDIWKIKIPSPIYTNSPEKKQHFGKYFPEEIKNYIETQPSEKLSYRGSKPIHYNVEFYCYGGSIPLTSLQKQMKLVIWWLSIIQKYTLKSCDDLVLTVYLTPLKKSLPKNYSHSVGGEGEDGSTKRKKILSPINCNTGFSTRCDMGNYIVIFRQEEWFKVFIHETFHYFGLDFAFDQPPFVDKTLERMFCVSSQIMLYESYTEFWAEMIVMLLYSTLHSKDFSTIIAEEITHSLGQAKKVLSCQDFTYSQVLSPCKKEMKYKEETNVFAYYIIKTIFLYFNEEFIGWCIENNVNLLQFSVSKLPSLLEWIKRHYKVRDFVEALENAEVNGNGLRMTNINI